MIFKIDKNPYDDRNMFKQATLQLPENEIYCLVGCNGSGKSTLIEYIQGSLIKQKAYQIKGRYLDFRGIFGEEKYSDTLAFYSFDKDTHESNNGNEDLLSRLGFNCSSTGEEIVQRLGSGCALLGDFIRNEKNKGKSLWIMFDDCDAGTSIDMINDVKRVIKLIHSDCQKNGITCTIILSANSYEMCKDYHCINVWDFLPVSFDTYEQYKKFVLNSRKRKDKQYEVLHK